MSATDLDRLIAGSPAVAAATAAADAGERAAALALARPAWPYALAALARAGERSLLAVAPGDDEARDLANELVAVLGRGAVALWPTRGVPAGASVGPSPHLVGQRARALATLGRPASVVVAGAPALAERVPAAAATSLEVRVGDRIELDELVDRLVALGYERVPQVEERGDLSVRGGILDVYPSTADLPARVELFGDEIESMRAFSAFTQRTIRPIDRLVAWPAAEPPDAGADPLADPRMALATVVRLAPGEHAAALREARERLEEEAQAGALAEPDAVEEALGRLASLDLAPPAGAGGAAFDAIEARFATRTPSEAEAELGRLVRSGLRVVLAFARRGEMSRAIARFDRLRPGDLGPGELPSPGALGAAVLPVRAGLISRELGVAIVPEERVMRRRRPAAQRGPVVGKRLQSFLDLKVGDHVVHEDHGIGRLTGFETRTVANLTRDYLALAFADGDRLYVPHDQLDKVTRYVGADGSAPALSKLGGKAWDRMKSRARAAVREMAGELIALYEARAAAKGFAFPADDELTRELERRFPYRETADQLRAIDAVADDMERPRPMDRLVCGDVGFGKTEVAMRAAFKAAAAGKQVLMLVPTTILAQQHLATFRDRFGDLPVSVDMVNRFRSAAETRDVLQRYRDGRLDVLIGTHRLLSMDVQPKDLGLVIVDEEQRFGVAQKESLRQLRLRVDVLAMSATPIPRTLQISLSGLRDISVIETPPPGRRPIATHVGEYDESLVAEALRREKARGGQSFFLHNRVETIEEAGERLRSLVPELRIITAHGQMHEHELEDRMLSFVRGEADVLVATTIIESGLDIPQANTLVVDRADALGLSQLYQIRGRVGRSDVTAHAYLFYPDAAALTREAASRLRALADYTELGSGLKIAMRDLEIRGAGNLLGDEQSGHVAAVGFELYLEMLNEAVMRGQGEEPAEADVRVDIAVSAYIPSDYVPLETAKIDLHRRIALASSLEEIATLRDEIEDRFGELPQAVEALLTVQRVRVKLRAAGASRIAVRSGRVTVGPVSLTSAQLRALREAQPKATYAGSERIASLPAGAQPGERLAAAEAALDALADTAALAA
ncbi:transcription-repair coupling factor [Miltoncostaea marina]|uniref:transcription-repair coupling factor n=1 Tax=Miltoncostaea marina TaxID=2843215 RepID=UPI001C3E00A4|nr:transcription-repair coupling factor [Miltoncostaea marina]